MYTLLTLGQLNTSQVSGIGGVQVLELCYYSDYSGRGWSTDSNSSANKLYYLFTGDWYRTISPHEKGKDGGTNPLAIYENGCLSSHHVDYVSGVLYSIFTF